MARHTAVLLLSFALLVAVPSAASAAPRSSYCSPTGDYCTSVKKEGGAPYLRLGTFSFTGRYRLCVTPPTGGRTCKRFRLREEEAGIYGSRVRWGAHFPDEGPGLYRVAWRKFGNRLGPRLGFRRG